MQDLGINSKDLPKTTHTAILENCFGEQGKWIGTTKFGYDESEATAPAETVSTKFKQTPPLAVVDHISHTFGNTTVGIVHHRTAGIFW